MRIIRWDESDASVFQGCVTAEQAAHETDDPAGPPTSAARMRVALGPSANVVKETWYAAGPGVAGYYRLRLPEKENLDSAFLTLTVHPAHRRQGIGAELLRHAAGRAAARGRSVLAGQTLQATAGDAFAKAVGARAGVTAPRRWLDVGAIPPGLVASLRKTAEQAAAGYSLTSFSGPVPEEHLAGVAYVQEAMNDAPSDYEDQRWDARRVREEINVRIERSGRRCRTVAAIHDATGQMAGLTEIEVEPEFPEWGFQEVTAVARPHRGHRLGALLKSAMLEWLAVAEPGLRMIETVNAAGNDHMISINEQLGFQVAHPWWQLYDIPVASVVT